MITKLNKMTGPVTRLMASEFRAVLMLWLLISGFLLRGESSAAQGPAPPAQGLGDGNAQKPIQDNSLLIEEAYNQEPGVVQHASFFTYAPESEEWIYSFTQEWPMPWDARHQFSYTIPAAKPVGATAGLGDVALNYRFQLLGDGDASLAFAPRISLFLPTGDSAVGRGFGGPSIQANLPASVVLTPYWVMHLNAGGGITPAARNPSGAEAAVTGFNLGQSFVWLAHPQFNVLLETLWTGQGEVSGPDQSAYSHSLFVSPAIRWAHNFSRGMQIVPGVGVAIGAGPSRTEKVLLVYLSVEHPF